MEPADQGIVGLLHPEGPYDDSKGGEFRRAIYSRLRGHYHHKNERKLFPDVHNETDFSINIYGGVQEQVSFWNMSNLFHPQTIGASLLHDRPHDSVPGMKTDEGNWNIRPHCDCIVQIQDFELKIFGQLLEDAATDYRCARLPHVHA